MQFDVSSYETSPEIYALEEKVKSESYATKSVLEANTRSLVKNKLNFQMDEWNFHLLLLVDEYTIPSLHYSLILYILS